MAAVSRFCLYGKPFDALEEGEGISKKPLAIDQQIVTDEKGRRRFHGAFTGGFSAGYFNTVDTKEGWTPSTFKSTRSMRHGHMEQRPEQFMDKEDFSEFGIAPREIKTRQQFSDETAFDQRGGIAEDQSNRFRPSQLYKEAERLAEIIKPAAQSFGALLLVKMGWRPGRGVGPLLEKAGRGLKKLSKEGSVYGCALPSELQNEEAESEDGDEETEPLISVSVDDVDAFYFDYKSDQHGLGYKTLRYSGVLNQSNLSQTVGIPGTKSSLGITGQAFGVGAFEDDDPDVYQTDDLSKFTFLTDTLAITSGEPDFPSDELVPSKRKGIQRSIFPPPVVPADFVTRKSVSAEQKLPITFGPEQVVTRTPEQRRAAFSESQSVFDLLSDADRNRLIKIKQQSKVPVKQKSPELRFDNVFEADPAKQQRFEAFLDHVRRERLMTCPPGVSEESWRCEVVEFVSVLPDKLRRAYELSKRNSVPLAPAALGRLFSERLNSKFVKSGKETDDIEKAQVENDEAEAVRMKMFGAMTRETWPWHPDRHLCKRFNVPNPYPDSSLIGVPMLKKAQNPVFMFGCETTTDTLSQLAEKHKIHETKHEKTPHVSRPVDLEADASIHHAVSIPPHDIEEEPVEEEQRLPMDLFRAVFTVSDSEGEADNADIDTGEEVKFEEANIVMEEMEPIAEPISGMSFLGSSETQFIEYPVVHVDPEELESPEGSPVYGPAPPPDSELESTAWSKMKSCYLLVEKASHRDKKSKHGKSSHKHRKMKRKRHNSSSESKSSSSID